mgnify:CR=1 FL=1
MTKDRSNEVDRDLARIVADFNKEIGVAKRLEEIATVARKYLGNGWKKAMEKRNKRKLRSQDV